MPGNEGAHPRGPVGWALWPFERLLRVEASSGIVLLAAALAALAWANSRWAAAYEQLWRTSLTLAAGPFSWPPTIGFCINDGLMTAFFLVVGLEIRRGFGSGSLADLRRALLPIAAAAGGMLVPALIYLAASRTPPASRGWGIPTATDIAFSVGVLALLGKRVPPALRVLLLALATVDDIGSIAIVSIFYPSGISVPWLIATAGGILGLALLRRLGIRPLVAYLLPSAFVWLGALHAGVHPAIAGVPIGLLVPIQKGEAAHSWVAYGVAPLFALANAGVSLQGLALGAAGSRTVFVGVLLARLLGKPAGIALAAMGAVGSGVCTLPRGVTWQGVLLIGCLGGIGLTVPLYIASVAFTDASLLAAAKLSLLAASVASTAVGLAVGVIVLPRPPAEG